MTCEPAEVSLLNGFRDLTLMGVQVRKCCEIRNVRFFILPTDSADSVFHHAHGVITTTNVALPWYRQAFDFNHMNNVLISRDCRKARLIDIDVNSKGSIQPLSWTSNPSVFPVFLHSLRSLHHRMLPGLPVMPVQVPLGIHPRKWWGGTANLGVVGTMNGATWGFRNWKPSYIIQSYTIHVFHVHVQLLPCFTCFTTSGVSFNGPGSLQASLGRGSLAGFASGGATSDLRQRRNSAGGRMVRHVQMENSEQVDQQKYS